MIFVQRAYFFIVLSPNHISNFKEWVSFTRRPSKTPLFCSYLRQTKLLLIRFVAILSNGLKINLIWKRPIYEPTTLTTGFWSKWQIYQNQISWLSRTMERWRLDNDSLWLHVDWRTFSASASWIIIIASDSDYVENWQLWFQKHRSNRRGDALFLA